MSADEMPCGCWGHADYEERCRYPKLEQDLSAERKRREGREEELHLERLAHTAAVTRAERAEADNAALLDVIRQMKDDDAWGSEHPGAALLERMRALESLANAVREYLLPTPPNREHDLLPVRNALAAYDALKVPHE